MTNPKYPTLLGKKHLFAPAFIGSLMFHCHSKIHSWLGCGRHTPSRQQQQGCGAPAYMQHKSCKNSYIIMCGGASLFLMLFCNNLQSGAHVLFCALNVDSGFKVLNLFHFSAVQTKWTQKCCRRLLFENGFVFVTRPACIFNWE